MPLKSVDIVLALCGEPLHNSRRHIWCPVLPSGRSVTSFRFCLYSMVLTQYVAGHRVEVLHRDQPLCCTCSQGFQHLHLLDCGASLPMALLRSLPLVAITIVRSDLASAEQAAAATRAATAVAGAPFDHVLHAAGKQAVHCWVDTILV